MRRIESRNIKKQAISALSDHPSDYRKLVFLHAAVSSVFLLVISLLGFAIDSAIVDTQGLSGIGTAGMLKSVYTICMLAGNILLPFWEMGILYTSLRVVRRQDTHFAMATQGFRRMAPLVGHYAMLLLIVVGIAFACFNVAVTPFLCMPLPEELEAAMQAIDFTDVAQIEAFQEEYSGRIMEFSMPFLIVYFVVYGVFVILLSYRFRMCSYLLLEDERAGVMASFGISSRMTKGEKKNLFILDLSFWWYHLLTILLSFVIYVPDFLAAAEVTLPVSYETANLAAYFVYIICYLALTGLAGAYYQTSMACAYETLRIQEGENSADL